MTPPLAPGARVRLAAKVRLRHDGPSGQVMLVYPESVLALNGPAGAIAELCDGRTLAEIVTGLAPRFRIPAETLRRDVEAFVGRLSERGLLEVLSP